MQEKEWSYSLLHLKSNKIYPDMLITAGSRQRKIYINGSYLITESGRIFFASQCLTDWIHKACEGRIQGEVIAESDNWTQRMRIIPKKECKKRRLLTARGTVPWGIFIS